MALSQSDLNDIKTLLNRDPRPVEVTIFDTMWSEHCSYKSSKDVLKKYLPTQGADVMLGIGEDSGIVYFAEKNGEKYGIAISHESHNHPSQILPIEGAATGVGGVVRDVYCMGADVFGVLNSLHFGIDDGENPLVDEIAREVVQGVGDYANPLGVPVLGGETLFHKSYNDNCLVNVAALGIVKESQIIHSFVPENAKTTPYDVILVGKSTDATGFGGASFSSATLDSDDTMTNLGAVQVHDPFLKRVTVEAIKELLKIVDAQNIEIGFKDLGAGGIACATSELGASAGLGVRINLDQVNIAIPDLPAEVIACSETQERFCFVVPKSFSQQVLQLFNDQFEMPNLYHNAGAAIIGEVIAEPVFELHHQGEVVCHLPIQAITTEVKAERHAEAPASNDPPTADVPNLSLSDAIAAGMDILGEDNNQSKWFVYRHFDHSVRGDTVIYPGEADAVVTTPLDGVTDAVAVSMDSNLYGEKDPFLSGAYAVAEGVRNVISVGAKPIAITDCLNYGNPEKPRVFYQFEEGVKGIAASAQAFGFTSEPLPVVSGNVSFYNESKQGSEVVPSPVIVVVGKMPDYNTAITMALKSPNSRLYYIGERRPEFGCTRIEKSRPAISGRTPTIDFESEHSANMAVHNCIQEGLVLACHDISMGGLWQSVIEMFMGPKGTPKVGLTVSLPDQTPLATLLFSESGGYVIEVPESEARRVEERLAREGLVFGQIGSTQSAPTLTFRYGDTSQEVSLDALCAQWRPMELVT